MALDIHYKLSLLSGWDFCFISRSAIFVTHNLAAWAVCCNICGLSLYPLSLTGFLSMSEMGVAPLFLCTNFLGVLLGLNRCVTKLYNQSHTAAIEVLNGEHLFHEIDSFH